jgi:hypothetical protein
VVPRVNFNQRTHQLQPRTLLLPPLFHEFNQMDAQFLPLPWHI